MESKRKIAVVGDIHGSIRELEQLLGLIKQEGVDEIFHLGDLVDRGEDSGAVVGLLASLGIKGVMGNHESKVLDLRERHSAKLPPDTLRTIESLDRVQGSWQYLRELPTLHVVDDVVPNSAIVLVHAGLWPSLSLFRQPRAVMFAQLINPYKPGEVAWYSDEEARDRGMVPWQALWDGDEYVVYGHSVFESPREEHRTIGIDTGCVFGGYLTALILPDFRYVRVKAKKAYASREGLYQSF